MKKEIFETAIMAGAVAVILLALTTQAEAQTASQPAGSSLSTTTKKIPGPDIQACPPGEDTPNGGEVGCVAVRRETTLISNQKIDPLQAIARMLGLHKFASQQKEERFNSKQGP